jgi:hypothetical protein
LPSAVRWIRRHVVNLPIPPLFLEFDCRRGYRLHGLIGRAHHCFALTQRPWREIRLPGRAVVRGSPTLTMALKTGGPVDAPAGGIAADSLAPRRIGTLVYPIAKRHLDHVVLVPDDAINRAQHVLWETLRVVAEPGGAADFAALLSGYYEPRPGEHVGILLSGGKTVAVNFGR